MKFHSLRNNLNNNTSKSDSLNIKELISKLDIIFEEKLSQTFKDILIIPRNKFLDIIISQVKKFLDEQFGDDIYKNEKFINFFSSSCNNLEDKYKTYVDELNQVWVDYNSKKTKNNENSFFFNKFRKHCIKTENFAMHKCSDNNIGYYILSQKKIKKGIGSQTSIQYLICNKCKSVYFTNKFINFCKECNENYLSSVLNHNEDPELLLATWKKPHCDTLVNERIKCKKCKNNFLYLNLKLNKLLCKNKSCTYNEIPYNIKWNCYICNESFYSNVKIYNPVEVQQIKDIIKLTLLLKKRAHPSKINCCKNIDLSTQNFYHKKECQGLLYLGEYNSKIIIVCEKCKAINFLIKFIWTCPLCGIRFKDKTILNDNNIEGNKQILNNYNTWKNKKEENNIIKNKDEDNDEQKRLRNNKSYGRKSKETLISLLRRRSGLSVDKQDNINNNENINKINRNIIENDSKTFNIRSIKYDENKENNNTNNNNNLKIIKLDSINTDKTSKYNPYGKHELKKSLSESKNLQYSYRRSTYLEKKISNIEPIKEENDIKNSSPIKKGPNVNTLKLREFTIQKEQSSRHKSKRIYLKNEEKKRDNCFSPRIKNTIYNKYLKYTNILTNTNNQDNNINNIKDEKNFTRPSRKKNEEENKNIIVYKNKEIKKNLENNTTNNVEENKEKSITNEKKINNEQNDCKTYDNKKLNDKEEINEKTSYRRKNNETNFNLNRKDNTYLSNYNTSKNILTNNSKLLTNKTQNRLNTLEIITNKEEIPNKWYKNNLLLKEKNVNFMNEHLNRNVENKEQINTFKVRKYNITENKKEENELNENPKTFIYRGRYENKQKENEKEKKIETNNNIDKNINEIKNKEIKIYLSNIDNISKNNENYKESLKEKKKKKEGEKLNIEMKDRKTVKSRKEILKEKEKLDNLNNYLLTEKKENSTINKINLNTLENQENKRYLHNKFSDSHQESIKTKENTISHYSKDTYSSKNNTNNNNIIRYKDNNKKDNNDINKTKNIEITAKIKSKENDYNTEKRTFYHTKKSRKDYINDRNKKITENINNEKTSEAKSFIPNKKEILTRTAYQTNKRSNIILNNIDPNIDKEEDIPIFDKDIRKDKVKYNQLQYQLKSILSRSCLPKFNIDYYIIKNQIGSGSFGIIFQVYNIKSRCKFALKKIIAPDISTLQKFVKEFELVHQNTHNHILDLIGVSIQCIDITNYVLYVLMDLAENDWDKEINYRAKIKKYYTENELINILKQLNSALYFLQKYKKIAHRDIKPENILIFKNDIFKIGDFGEAKENKNPKQFNTLRGTELYMSPLLYNSLHEKKEDVKHNQYKSDMFSLGYCFVYAASLNLDIIFKIRDINNTISLKKILMIEFNKRYSGKFVDLILKMIDYNEERRIDFIELEKILREEF